MYINWFNHPVWTFYKDDEGVTYANIRYAKNYLKNPNMPGPHHGVNITLENGMLTRHGRDWFD